MPTSHLLLALLVVAVWGTNFVVAHEGLNEFPPLTLGVLRILFASLPLLPFVPRPTCPADGGGIWAAYWCIAVRAAALCFGRPSPAGLASTLIQMQAFFTAAVAAVVDGERLDRRDLLGLAVAGLGIAIIGAHAADGDVSILGIVCVLGAALAWGFANVVVRRARPSRVISLVAWSNSSRWRL
jgi:O-acetylserine/cysteine efflux transporter